MKLKEEEDEAVVVATWGLEGKAENSDIGVVSVTGHTSFLKPTELHQFWLGHVLFRSNWSLGLIYVLGH